MTEPRGVSMTLEGAVATVTFSRPPVNVLDAARLRALDERVAEAAAEPGVKLIALAGLGRDFSAGTDIKEHTPEAVEGLLRDFHALMRRLLTCDVPTVALVQGRALGGGAELALACDFIFAETTSSFGFPEIRLGVFPPAASVLLERRVGRSRAADLVPLRRLHLGRERGKAGPHQRAREPRRPDPRARHDAPAAGAALGVDVAGRQKALRRGATGDALGALDAVERIYLDELMKTDDAKEGVAAYLAKRPPAWKNR